MSTTAHLNLPLLAAAQAQKHVTHNEALTALDALVQLAVIERNRTAPPASPGQGDRYLIGSPATGDFTGHEGEIAFFDLGLWRFLDPGEGWLAYIAAEDRMVVFDGTAWQDLGHYNRDLDNIQRLGVGTAADDLNRFAVKLNAALFTALATTEGGTGDLRVALNKTAAANILSHLYQRGYSGRAETGLIGGEDYSIRVSADGSLWRNALAIDRNTGLVSFPSGLASSGPGADQNLLINSAFLINQRAFTGGSLAAGAFGFDRWKGGPGGCTLGKAADGTMTLTGSLDQIVELGPAASIIDAPHFGGRSLTISVEDPSAALTVTVGSKTATIAAGSGRRFASVTLDASETDNLLVRLQAPAATTFKRPKLEIGSAATPWSALPLDLEETRCRRYYQKVPCVALLNAVVGALGHRVGANIIEVPVTMPVAMRVAPAFMTNTISWINDSPSGTQAGFYESVTASWAAISGSLSVVSYGTPGLNAVILRFIASVSFSGNPGTTGTLFLGNSALVALQSEL